MTKLEIVKELIQLYKKSRYGIDFIKNTLNRDNSFSTKELLQRYEIAKELYKEREKKTFNL